MVYGAALERRFVGDCIEGSNPSPSAMKIDDLLVVYFHDEVGFEPSSFA